MTEPAKTLSEQLLELASGPMSCNPENQDVCNLLTASAIRIGALERVGQKNLQRIAELEAASVWLDKPDKPGWWLMKQNGDGPGFPKYDAKYLYESDMNWEAHERVYKGCLWRFISE